MVWSAFLRKLKQVDRLSRRPSADYVATNGRSPFKTPIQKQNLLITTFHACFAMIELLEKETVPPVQTFGFLWHCEMVIKIAATGWNKLNRRVYWNFGNEIKKPHSTTAVTLPLRVRANILPTLTHWLFSNSLIEAWLRRGRFIIQRAILYLIM